MKHDAIVEQGIPIIERVPIPDDMIPEDSRVEIDAKIHAGYCKYAARIPSAGGANIFTVTNGKVLSLDELSQVQGRAWEDVDVSLSNKYIKLNKTDVTQALN